MRFERSVTSISWIPSEAMTGLMRLPMDLGIGHYDTPPPDALAAGDLERLRTEDRYRFANRLAVTVDVEDGSVVGAEYVGGGLVGSTTANIGVRITIPAVAFPVLQEAPVIEGDKVRFVQTAGGRTGAPLPRRIDRPPFVRMTAPTAWTTLALTVHATGEAEFELVGASPFPRHWIYDDEGSLTAKSGLIDFAEWTRVHDHDRSPWHDFERSALMADVESQVERELSHTVMAAKPDFVHLSAGSTLIEQGHPGGPVYLILDGMLRVAVDDKEIAELGPGAIVGERAILETGKATATVTAITQVRAAAIDPELLALEDLAKVASGHRREEADASSG